MVSLTVWVSARASLDAALVLAQCSSLPRETQISFLTQSSSHVLVRVPHHAGMSPSQPTSLFIYFIYCLPRWRLQCFLHLMPFLLFLIILIIILFYLLINFHLFIFFTVSLVGDLSVSSTSCLRADTSVPPLPESPPTAKPRLPYALHLICILKLIMHPTACTQTQS